MSYSTKDLRDHPYSNCYVRKHDNGDIDFISYSTRVISVTASGIIECTGLYSATTRRQIGWFCREYLPGVCYQDIKGIAGRGYVDINTLI